MIALERRKHALVTADDRGAMLAVITWFLACAVVGWLFKFIRERDVNELKVICAAIRLATRFTSRQLAKFDNILIGVAVVCGSVDFL